MGIFDWLFGKKKSKPKKKVVKKTKKKVVKKPKKKVKTPKIRTIQSYYYKGESVSQREFYFNQRSEPLTEQLKVDKGFEELHFELTEQLKVNKKYTHEVKSKVFFEKKLFTGKVFVTDENEKIIEEFEVLKGVKNGYYKKWTETGFLKSEQTFKRGKLHGLQQTHHNDEEQKLKKTPKLIDGKYRSESEKRVREHQGWSREEYDDKLKEILLNTINKIQEEENTTNNTNEKYKKIQGYLNVHFVNDLSEILELDFDNNDIELFFGFKSVYEGSCYQCIKHENNTKSEKISTFNEGEHIRDVSEFDVEEEFDETCEVFDGRSYSVWLKKIKSREFIVSFMKKIRDYCSKNDGDISDFLLENNCEVMGSDDLEEVYIKLGGNPEDYETIFDDMDIDDKGNLINWFSYNQIEEEYFQIGYRIN